MTRHDDDIIGTRPTVDLGPLFAHPTPIEAETEIRRDFLEPEPPTRARDENAALTGMTNAEREEAIERIKREVREPLVTLAFERRNAVLKDDNGVTAADVRAIAERKGLAQKVGTEQRAWSWIAGWFAENAKSGQLVKYKVAGMTVKRMSDSGNENAIYLHPYDHRARGAA